MLLILSHFHAGSSTCSSSSSCAITFSCRTCWEDKKKVFSQFITRWSVCETYSKLSPKTCLDIKTLYFCELSLILCLIFIVKLNLQELANISLSLHHSASKVLYASSYSLIEACNYNCVCIHARVSVCLFSLTVSYTDHTVSLPWSTACTHHIKLQT